MLGNLIADMGATVTASVQAPPAVESAPAVQAVAEVPAAVPPAPREVVNIRTRKPAAKPAGQGTLRDRSKQLSLYLEEPVYDALREIAHVERSKMHQLIVEGIDLLLKKKGSPSISELLKKAG
jgi:hypothetical protein